MHDVESSIRGILRGFGLRVGVISKGKFEARIRELVAGQAMLERVAKPLLRARAALGAEYRTLHRQLLATVREVEVCRRLMTVPGVGAVVAVTFRSAIDQPARFTNRRRSGQLRPDAEEIPVRRDRPHGSDQQSGRRHGTHGVVRGRQRDAEPHGTLLGPEAWALRVAGRHGMKKAKVALARKLAVAMHRMWVDGTNFRWGEARVSAA